jgi:hypothetical protein
MKDTQSSTVVDSDCLQGVVAVTRGRRSTIAVAFRSPAEFLALADLAAFRPDIPQTPPNRLLLDRHFDDSFRTDLIVVDRGVQ